MQFVFNAFGYELAVAFRKKEPGPAVFIAENQNISVNDVVELMTILQAKPA